jgi:hypothetical protein
MASPGHRNWQLLASSNRVPGFLDHKGFRFQFAPSGYRPAFETRQTLPYPFVYHSVKRLRPADLAGEANPVRRHAQQRVSPGFLLRRYPQERTSETLEVGNSSMTDTERTQGIRDEIEVLENDRDFIGSADRESPTGDGLQAGG